MKNLKEKLNAIALLLFISLFIGSCEKEEDFWSDRTTKNIEVLLKASVPILNSSFESSFDDWVDIDPSAISGDEYTGSRSAKITGEGGLIYQEVAIDANTNYTLQAWVMGDGLIGATVGLVDYENGGSFDNWTQVSVVFNSGDNTEATIYAAYNGGTGRFDDFTMTSDGTDTTIIITPTVTKLTVVSVEASEDDGNLPLNTQDEDLSTRWSANGEGQYITFELDSIRTITSVDIAWYKGNSRSANFDILIGESLSNLTQVFSGSSSGSTLNLESTEINSISGKYIQIIGYGNSSNSWNSITEVEIYGIIGKITPSAPIANIVAPTTGTTGTTVAIDGSASYDPDGGSVSYLWDFGDETSATAATVEHTYETSGEYTITLSITDNEDSTATASHTILIEDTPTYDPIAQIAASETGSVGVEMGFNGSGSADPDGGEIVSYAWNFGDGSTSSEENPSHTYTTAGTYTVSLVVTDDKNVASAPTEIAVEITQVNPNPDLWPFWDPSFEESSSFGGWYYNGDGVSKNGTSNPMPVDGSRLLRITGTGSMDQYIYKPEAGRRYKFSIWVYNHGTIGITDLGNESEINEVSTNHGETWQQISVTYRSTGSPAYVYIKQGTGSDDAYFDLAEIADITTDEDLNSPAPIATIKYPSQILDVSMWKITMPFNSAEEHYTPELYTYTVPEFRVVQDNDGYAVAFKAAHGGSTTSGSSNPRSEFRELQENYHYQNSKSAADWSNTDGKHHIMWIKQKVTHLTSVKPHVVVGQIHDSGDDVVVFRMEGHNGTCPEGTDDDWDNCGTPGVLDTHANLWITNGNDRHGYLLDDNYELGTVFTVKMDAHDGVVDFEYNGQPVNYTHTESISGCYFKLGNYTQSNSGTAPNETNDAYAETYVYDYYVTHE